MAFNVQAQSSKITNAHLQKATVYLQGANLFYSENVMLQAGNNEIVFENISPSLNDASLQASSRGGVVMEVKHLLKYKEKVMVTRQYDKEIQNVVDSLDDLSYDVKDLDNKLTVLATSKHMLLNNRIIKGEPQRDSLALLRDGMQFLQEKLNSIYEQELKLEHAKSRLLKQKNKLDARYKMLILLQSGQDVATSNSAQSIHQVVVTLFSELATAATINFNYYVPYANWVPQYDIQASSVSGIFQLKYFADVTQNTGVDWSNVPITLSTSNPSESNNKPELNPWYLSFIAYQQGVKTLGYAAKVPSSAGVYEATIALKKKESSQDDSKVIEDYIQVTESLIRTEYEIKLNYNIASDGKVHKVLINQRDMPMQLHFAAVPKICTDAFLIAKVSDWEDLNIIPGNARLYFDGGYVGNMYLSANTTNDTLNVNLGRDKTIAITRKKIKENTKDKFIEQDKIETRSVELTVRNTKNVPIEIILEDQIPLVSGTNEIKVTLIKAEGAEMDELTGKLTWNLKLNVKESKKVVFTYEIRHPKGKQVVGL